MVLPCNPCIGEWGSCSTLSLQSSCPCASAAAGASFAKPSPEARCLGTLSVGQPGRLGARTERGACTPHHLQPGISTLRSELADMGEGGWKRPGDGFSDRMIPCPAGQFEPRVGFECSVPCTAKGCARTSPSLSKATYPGGPCVYLTAVHRGGSLLPRFPQHSM